MKIAVANASNLCANPDVQTATDAVRAQLVEVAAKYDREEPTVEFTGGLNDPVPDDVDVVIVVLDDADQAGALGYHAETPDGRPFARVFARDSIAGLGGIDPATLTAVQPGAVVLALVAQVISHEAVEAFADSHANEWADDGNGTAWAYELCDPVESDTYTIDVDGQTVTLSNWVTPAFFDPQATAPDSTFDYLGHLAAPLSIDVGGYAITETEGQPTETFGDELPAWRKAQHEARHPGSRTGKRFAHLGGAASSGPGSEPPAPDAPPAGPGPDAPPPVDAEVNAEVDAEVDVPEVDWNPSEPVPVGAHVIQDNVSEPGVEITHHIDYRTGDVTTVRHGDPEPDTQATEEAAPVEATA